MRLTDIWYSDTKKETGENFGAKAKINPGENAETESKNLKEFVKKMLK